MSTDSYLKYLEAKRAKTELLYKIKIGFFLLIIVMLAILMELNRMERQEKIESMQVENTESK